MNRSTCGSWILLAFLLVVGQACRSGADSSPESLIPKEKMVKVLTAIHLAEARVSKLGIKTMDSSNLVYKRLETQIFQRYNVDTATYNRSYAYYAANPDKLQEIYEQVVKTLEQRKKASQAATDSLKPAKRTLQRPKNNKL